jgi:hypothetical protein
MISCAIALAVGFWIVEHWGWRESTSVISGTIPLAGGGSALEANMRATVYALLWFGMILAAPVLLTVGLVCWWRVKHRPYN